MCVDLAAKNIITFPSSTSNKTVDSEHIKTMGAQFFPERSLSVYCG